MLEIIGESLDVRCEIRPWRENSLALSIGRDVLGQWDIGTVTLNKVKHTSVVLLSGTRSEQSAVFWVRVKSTLEPTGDLSVNWNPM